MAARRSSTRVTWATSGLPFDFQAVGASSQYCVDPVTIHGLLFYRLRRIVQRKTPDPLFTASIAVLIEVAHIGVSKAWKALRNLVKTA